MPEQEFMEYETNIDGAASTYELFAGYLKRRGADLDSRRDNAVALRIGQEAVELQIKISESVLEIDGEDLPDWAVRLFQEASKECTNNIWLITRNSIEEAIELAGHGNA